MDWQKFYRDVDETIGQSVGKPIPRSLLTNYALYYCESPHRGLADLCKSFSMLHQETLTALNLAARRSRGAVLEIGPYIGGSTVAIGEGLKGKADSVHVIVEIGGSYETHSHYPSKDIIGDLKKRIADHDLKGTHLLQGWSYDEKIIDAVDKALGGRKVDLLFIDSDGETGRDFANYERFLAPECIVILDDFLIQESDSSYKQIGVRSWVSKALDAGIVRDLGVYLWSTWAGQYVGRS